MGGQVLNNAVFSLLEEKAAGIKAIPLTGNKTLDSQNFASNEVRQAFLVFSNGGGLSIAPTVTVPAKQNWWFVVNNTGQTVTLTAGATAASIVTGRKAIVWCDGVEVFSFDPKAEVAASEAAAAQSAADAESFSEDAASSASDALGYRNTSQSAATSALNTLAAINSKFIVSTQPPSNAQGNDGDVYFLIA